MNEVYNILNLCIKCIIKNINRTTGAIELVLINVTSNGYYEVNRSKKLKLGSPLCCLFWFGVVPSGVWMATLNVPPLPPSPRDDAIQLYAAFKGSTDFLLLFTSIHPSIGQLIFIINLSYQLQDLDAILALWSIYLLIEMLPSVPTSNKNTKLRIPLTFSNAYLLWTRCYHPHSKFGLYLETNTSGDHKKVFLLRLYLFFILKEIQTTITLHMCIKVILGYFWNLWWIFPIQPLLLVAAFCFQISSLITSTQSFEARLSSYSLTNL